MTARQHDVVEVWLRGQCLAEVWAGKPIIIFLASLDLQTYIQKVGP